MFTLPYKPPPGQEHDENQPGLGEGLQRLRLPFPELSLNTRIARFADSTRLRQYEEAWSICAARIQETLASLHDASLDRIVTFVRSRPSDTDPLALYAALSGGRVPLKTGLILGRFPSTSSAPARPDLTVTTPATGASPGSSSLIYNSLIRQLVHPSRSRDTADQFKSVIVSRLTSRECSNIKNALRSLIAGFVGSDADLEADDDDDEDAASCTLRDLQEEPVLTCASWRGTGLRAAEKRGPAQEYAHGPGRSAKPRRVV